MPKPSTACRPLEYADPLIKIAVPTLQEARQALANWKTKRPHPNSRDFEAWLDQKNHLELRLDLAESEAKSAWKPVPAPDRPVPQPPAPQPEPRPRQASAKAHIPRIPEATMTPLKVAHVAKTPEERAEAKKKYQRDWLAKKKAQAKAAEHPVPETEPRIRETSSAPTRHKPLGDLRALIIGQRSQTWSLLADLECLPLTELRQLTSDLGILSAATQTAVELAERAAETLPSA